MVLRQLQKAGHKPVILIGSILIIELFFIPYTVNILNHQCIGGGTTKVGDPTGKDESRQLLSEEQIQENIDSLTKVL